MRPRPLRRRLILVGLGGMFVAAAATTGVARATPDVCASLAASPTVGTVEQLVYSFTADGWSAYESGEIIAIAVLGRCPQHRPVIEAFVRAYAPEATGHREVLR